MTDDSSILDRWADRVGHMSGLKITYIADPPIPGMDIASTTAHAAVRDWDITDPEARLKAAVAVLGPIDESNWLDAQWFINEDRNAAALLVYSPSKFQAYHTMQEATP